MVDALFVTHMFAAFTIRRYLDYMEQGGFGPVEVLAGTGVDPARLLDKAYFIPVQQRNAVIANMLRLTGNPALGFDLGYQTRFAQMGAFGHVLLSSNTIWEQYRHWLQYAEPLLGLPMSVSLFKRESGLWSATFRDPVASGAVHRFGVEELLMFSRKITQSLSGEPLRLTVLRLDYPAPAHAHRYRDYFKCQPEFDCPRFELEAAAPFADEFFPGQEDHAFARACLSHCRRLLQEVNGSLSVGARLRELLGTRLGDLPSINEASRILGMSERTLRRRLTEEGTGFQDVHNAFRYELAEECLLFRGMKAKEVAGLLGFNHVSDFRRAFKSWSGCSISDYLNHPARSEIAD